jgi:hypothetical protein
VLPPIEAGRAENDAVSLISGLTAAHPELVGEPYADADGHQYLRLLGVPVLVFEGGAETLRVARRRAAERAVPTAVYTRDMFGTGHDADNRAVVAAVPGSELDLVGLGLHAPRNVVDKIIMGARLHP